MSQTIFISGAIPPNDRSYLWCSSDTAPAWNGEDLSECFRNRVMNGYIPACFLAVSLLIFLVLIANLSFRCLYRYYSSAITATPCKRDRRLSTSSRHSTSSIQCEFLAEGLNAIGEAELEVLLRVVEEESPSVHTMKSSTTRKSGHLRVGGDRAEEQGEDDVEREAMTVRMLLRTLFTSKKEMMNVAGSIAILSLLVQKFVVTQSESTAGSNWFTLTIATWIWLLILSIYKFILSFLTKLRRFQSPTLPYRSSSLYQIIELQTITFFLIFSITTFFDARSAVLTYFFGSTSPEALFRNVALFSISTTCALVEITIARPSRFFSYSTTLPVSPEIHSSLLSLALFSFINPFMYTVALQKEKYSMNIVPDLRPDDKAASVVLSYRTDTASLARSKYFSGLACRLVYHFRSELLQQQLWSFLRVATVALPPLFLQAILAHISKRSRGEPAPLHVGLLYAFGLLISQMIAGLAASQALFIGRRVCIRLRSTIIAEVFQKALRRKDQASHSKVEEGKVKDDVTEEDKEKANAGKIVNLISVDTFRLSEVCAYAHFIWPELPLTIGIVIFLLFRVLGLATLAGLLTLILLSPLQALILKVYYKYHKRLLAAADARLTLAAEVISSIRLIKYFAWESKFASLMDESRQKEISALYGRARMMICGQIAMYGSPTLTMLAAFGCHTKLLKLSLTAETAFTSLALFNILRGPLDTFLDTVMNVAQANISLRRIDEFLREQESEKYAILKSPTLESDPIVGFVGASFTWSDATKAREDGTIFRIQELNLNFPVDRLSIIYGPVGCGKTTLLLSLLGETNRLSGASFCPSPVVRSIGDDPSILTESTAYCSQSAWVLSATVRENIVFGSAFNEKRYDEVIEACALSQDLKQLELGDETQVGEKGTVLSGGQKARISLARAIYSSARYILLDDVLSATDSHTSAHLFHQCLTGPLMINRTCILVTHAIDLCMRGAAFVVSMDSNGSIISSSSPSFTRAPSPSTSSAPVSSSSSTVFPTTSASPSLDNTDKVEVLTSDTTDDAKAKEREARAKKLQLIKEETQSSGAVNHQVYGLYIRALGGWPIFFFAILIFVIAQLSETAVAVALRYWAASYGNDDAESFNPASMKHSSFDFYRSLPFFAVASRVNIFGTGNAETDYWLAVYCGISFFSLVLFGLRVYIFMQRSIAASKSIYVALMTSILGAPIRFFDSTPQGRILNRLSKDIETIDQEVGATLLYLLVELLAAASILATISYVLPTFLIASILIIFIYWGIGYLYLASSRELKRSESVTKSPIFSLFGETLHGVASIRAYGDGSRFIRSILQLLDTNNRPFFALWLANRWLSVRIDFAGAIVSFATALFVLYAAKMDAATAGFVLSFAVALNERTLWCVRLWSMNEINMNSVERVKEYLELDQEKSDGITPPAAWPSRDGTIEVEGLTASYAADLPPVLKSVSFSIRPKEKIGIVGRTGSGKSTLGLSFLRFIEPSSGRIVIDGIDINTLKLSELRKRLTIVSQEVSLFAGSLRFNLDPFNQFEDLALWDALRRVQLASPISSSEENDRFIVKSLEMEVAEGGRNFSAGQRQLISLARGILKLRESTILLLDESTASLDHATDEFIQKTIRDEMREATILCIAHRLNTIIDYDRILVLSDGEVVEFDTPANLLDRPESAFSLLCRRSGDFDQLFELAQAARVV